MWGQGEKKTSLYLCIAWCSCISLIHQIGPPRPFQILEPLRPTNIFVKTKNMEFYLKSIYLYLESFTLYKLHGWLVIILSSGNIAVFKVILYKSVWLRIIRRTFVKNLQIHFFCFFCRYLTIMNPLRPRMTHNTTMTILIFIWIVSAVVVIPTAIYSKTFIIVGPGGQIMTQCGEVGWQNSALKANTLFLVIGEFIFPLLLMCIIYFLIARRLWFRQVPCDHLTEQQEASAEASKRRTIRMLIIVVGLFAVCWAPYNGFSIARDFYLQTRQESSYKIINTVFYMVEALAMSNSMFNTLIYIFFNANFRKCVFQMFTPAHRTCSYQSTVRVRYSRPTQAAKASSNHYDACNNRHDTSQETARTSFYQSTAPN